MKKAPGNDLVDIEGKVRFTTDEAYLFFFSDKAIVLLPKSQCEWDESSETMTMPEWLAIEKELV